MRDSVRGTMAGMWGKRAWSSWQVAACLVVLCSPILAEAPKSAQPGGMAPTSLQLGMEPIHDRLMVVARRVGAEVAAAYERSPVIVLGLGLAGALPVLAALFAIGRVVQRRTGRQERLEPVAEPTPLADKAWIDIGTGPEAQSLAFTGEMLRIGRHSDNDIALEHAAVHRHHALIQRTPDDEFILMDLTAGTGNETLLNGRPAMRAVLADGDRIALGDTVLIFRLGVETPAKIMQPEAYKSAPKPATAISKETTDDERDAGDGRTGRAADRVETRRIGSSDRIAARGAHRGRAR